VDSNCCIKAVLEFGDIRDFYKRSIDEFFEKSKLRRVELGYFQIIREEAERNLTKAVHELFKKRGGYKRGRHVEILNAIRKGFKKMEKLFDEKLRKFDEDWTQRDIQIAKNFFESRKKPLQTQRSKNPIPGENDLKILISTAKLTFNKRGILSDDSHFTEYRDEILSKFNVIILDLKEINQIMNSWNWR